MEENCSNVLAVDSPISQFDKIIELLIILLLAFMPLAFGAFEPWSEEVVIILSAVISIVFIIKLIVKKDSHLIWSWSYIPLLLFVLTAVFQLAPLPADFVSAISPNTAVTKADLLNDLADTQAVLDPMTLTFYPNATRNDLRLVISAAVIFIVVLNVYRRPDQIKRLLGTIAVIGGLIALLALLQDLFGNGNIYWFVPTESGKANSATFINHSHYGQFMNLSIGAALALVLVKLHQAFTKRKVTPSYIAEYLGSSDAKNIYFLLAMIILGAATVFISLTRGGMVSMLIAAGFTTVVLSSRQTLRDRGWLMLLLTLGAFICVLYVGFDAVYDRLATLQELNQFDSRWQIVKDIATAWTRFPVFGTGLGTHEVVYPMFDRASYVAIASHAENEYAQAAEETGIVGVAFLLLFGIVVWSKYLRNIRSSSIPIRSAAYGLGFGLLAISIHSFSDFGQHLPANAFLSLVFCALLIGLAQIGTLGNSTIKIGKPTKSLKLLYVVLLIGISAIWLWAVPEADNARLAQANWNKVLTLENNIEQRQQEPTDEEYISLISYAAKAVVYQPENITYQHGVNVYRWLSVSNSVGIEDYEDIIPQELLSIIERIADEFHKARTICPTYGPTYCVVGQIEKFILGNPEGANLIRKGYELAMSDPTACLVAGILDIEENQIEESFNKFSRAVELDSRFFQAAADTYIYDADKTDLAIALASDNRSRLSYIADSLSEIEEYQELAKQVQSQVIELLRQECSQPDASAHVFASYAGYCARENDIDAAIESYTRALELEYGQINWRFALARLLAQTGRNSDAIDQARICLWLRPQFTQAENLIAELSVLPGIAAEGIKQ